MATSNNATPSPSQAVNFLNIIEKLKVIFSPIIGPWKRIKRLAFQKRRSQIIHRPPLTTTVLFLQTTPRTGWVKRGVKNPESIADHMYRMGVMSLLVQGTGYDYAHCMKLAIVHDIAESTQIHFSF